MNDQTNSQSVFIVKKVLKALGFLCTFFVFMPSFLVSCSGQDMEITLMDAAGGIKASGETIVDPHPLLLLCLVIPIAILVLLFMKKYSDDLKAKVIAGTTALDLIIWFIFRAGAKSIAEENYCTFKSTGWFIMNIICLLITLVLSGMVVAKKLSMDSDVLAYITGGEAKNNLKDISGKLSEIADNIKKKTGSN